MLELTGAEPTCGVTELEGPEEITRLLEIGADGKDLVDQVFHADDAKLAQRIFDELVVCERYTLLVDFAVAALVDKFAHGFDGWEAVGDVRLDKSEHFRGGFGEADEDAVVDLEESQELEDFTGFGSDLINAFREGGISLRILNWVDYRD